MLSEESTKAVALTVRHKTQNGDFLENGCNNFDQILML
jgi:hypothetical protein